MVETLSLENELELIIREKIAMLPEQYQREPFKTTAEWTLWQVGLCDIKYEQFPFRIPPFKTCKIDLKECQDCGDASACPIRTMEIVCPKCGKKGYVSHAIEESGWRYVCVACEEPFDQY